MGWFTPKKERDTALSAPEGPSAEAAMALRQTLESRCPTWQDLVRAYVKNAPESQSYKRGRIAEAVNYICTNPSLLFGIALASGAGAPSNEPISEDAMATAISNTVVDPYRTQRPHQLPHIPTRWEPASGPGALTEWAQDVLELMYTNDQAGTLDPTGILGLIASQTDEILMNLGSYQKLLDARKKLDRAQINDTDRAQMSHKLETEIDATLERSTELAAAFLANTLDYTHELQAHEQMMREADALVIEIRETDAMLDVLHSALGAAQTARQLTQDQDLAAIEAPVTNLPAVPAVSTRPLARTATRRTPAEAVAAGLQTGLPIGRIATVALAILEAPAPEDNEQRYTTDAAAVAAAVPIVTALEPWGRASTPAAMTDVLEQISRGELDPSEAADHLATRWTDEEHARAEERKQRQAALADDRPRDLADFLHRVLRVSFMEPANQDKAAELVEVAVGICGPKAGRAAIVETLRMLLDAEGLMTPEESAFLAETPRRLLLSPRSTGPNRDGGRGLGH